MQGWHAKKYTNKVRMMHESKVNILGNPIPTESGREKNMNKVNGCSFRA